MIIDAIILGAPTSANAPLLLTHLTFLYFLFSIFFLVMHLPSCSANFVTSQQTPVTCFLEPCREAPPLSQLFMN